MELLTTKQVEKETSYLNLRKAPGRMTRMLKELLRKGIVLITYIFNSILRESHWPEQLKTDEIILILKQYRIIHSNKLSSHHRQRSGKISD